MSDSHLAFPTIEGQNLLRAAVRLPDDLPAQRAVVVFAFSPGHQAETVSWVPTLEGIATGGTAAVRQAIVLPGLLKMGERMVLDQLTKSVPAEAHAFTILAFGDPGAVAKALGADTSHVVLAVLDEAHRVVWTASGPHTVELETALRSQL